MLIRTKKLFSCMYEKKKVVNFMKNNTSIHPDLRAATRLAYDPNNLIYDAIVQEEESAEYGACKCKINDKTIVFRVAKITPTKIGQFVTAWKRIGKGPILPYDSTDLVDLFVISVRDSENFGQFVFPKTVLEQKGIISKNGKSGKRGFRIYPPWDKANNPQAKKSQAWQLLYFFEIEPNLDSNKLKKLFS